MTGINALTGCAFAAAVAILAACGKDDLHQGKPFDAAYVAAEADRGNLAPLKALVDACHAEVKKLGRREEVCGVLDAVAPLRKPLSIRF